MVIEHYGEDAGEGKLQDQGRKCSEPQPEVKLRPPNARGVYCFREADSRQITTVAMWGFQFLV